MQAFYLGCGVFWSVLVAELIGDKTIYTVTSLALRVRAATVFCVIVLVFMVKMGIAVLLGGLVMRLQSPLVAAVSAGAFFASALLVMLRRREPVPEAEGNAWGKGTLACLTPLLLTEWGDPGQIVAAASSARFHLPLVVWVAGTLAMITKGTLALIVGRNLRGYLPQKMLRVMAAVSLGVLGIITLAHLNGS